MPERDLLVAGVVAEILGPRGGPGEVLRVDEDPLDEYITGVLAPRGVSSLAPDNLELDGGSDAGADDDQDPGDPVEAPGAAMAMPALDPRARPASVGLSFVLEGAAPAIDLCATWARYRRTTGGGWRRQPHGREWTGIDCLAPPPLSVSSDPGVELTVRCRTDGARWRVSIFLVNVTPAASGFPGADVHVFQPQIRVHCPTGTRLVPLEEGACSREDEERGLALLYSGRPALARGHLCAAMWADIDPESTYGFTTTRPPAAPFTWPDGTTVLGGGAGRYSPADARTEFVPALAVLAPEKGWTSSLTQPQLDPEILAQTWDGATLRSMLEPLPLAYEQWILDREAEAASLAPDREALARRNLTSCRTALQRIRAGIELLATEENARLAFCFANRAIALQSQWTRGRVNEWYPFQLAFQLLNLRAIATPAHADRDICDLLWYPTGGGKTEAYLGLAALTMGLRRLRAGDSGERTGRAGVAVLSRYTLRLLTIQQFRRALAVVTACEYLRIFPTDHGIGWRPTACKEPREWLWGTERFSAGLWVGGTVTPNLLQDFQYQARNGAIRTVHGAISILEDTGRGEGEPAQVLTCPACSGTLAVPPDGYQPADRGVLHLVVGDRATTGALPAASVLSRPPFEVTAVDVVTHADPRFSTVSLCFTARDEARPGDIDNWWTDHLRSRFGPDTYLVAARASRPGYFVRTADWGVRRRTEKPYDFEVFCPNPACALNVDVSWTETTPAGTWPVPDAFRLDDGSSSRCPISAWTIDEQVYHRLPSMLIATVDKFARLSFEPKAGAIFGNVDRYHERLGYHRLGCPPSAPGRGLPPRPETECPVGRTVRADALLPPDLILQDELHLIEGPLGSMVGLYETAVDLLASASAGTSRVRPKYVASTATVRRALEQSRSLFLRELEIFPGPGLTADDSFFAVTGAAHAMDCEPPGRLYLGVCAPGRGAQTPIVRLWSRLLQHVSDRQAAGASFPDLDRFWTLVGYFNAMRELAGAVALARQDILQRLSTISATPRQIDENEPMELSSRADSLTLPGMLEQLKVSPGGTTPASNLAVATSMFGTGVDVDRLGLMMVAGQPKTTSAYIQATGRVGRSAGGLVITFYRAARPRDLNHYEFFTAYHNALYRHVEPVTVNPFAPRARDRALGPLAVAILRQAVDVPSATGTAHVDGRWRAQQRISGGWYCLADDMAGSRLDPEVVAIPQLVEQRAQGQPQLRSPAAGEALNHAASELDRWQQLAARQAGRLVYAESTQVNPPSRPVVLGDRAHLLARFDVAYEDAPNSLRDVEPTITVRGWLTS